MKDYVFILLLLLSACYTPSDPVGISVSYQEHIDTVDFYLNSISNNFS